MIVTLCVHSRFSQKPRVLVVAPETIGIQKVTKGSKESTKEQTELQTVFDKLFGTSLDSIADLSEINKSDTTVDDKNDIILGALRDILLICEVCKKKTENMIPTTTKPLLTTDRAVRQLPNITTLPPPGW